MSQGIKLNFVPGVAARAAVVMAAEDGADMKAIEYRMQGMHQKTREELLDQLTIETAFRVAEECAHTRTHQKLNAACNKLRELLALIVLLIVGGGALFLVMWFTPWPARASAVPTPTVERAHGQ